MKQALLTNLLEPAPAHISAKTCPPAIMEKMAPAKPTEVFLSYWYFAAERQRVFHSRIASKPKPWSSDAILANYKFTNAYRASDRVSQFLIRNVLYDQKHSSKDLFFRCLLFKIFNKIDTWKLLKAEFGDLIADEFDADKYDRVLQKAMQAKQRIYSAAYIMPSGGRWFKAKYKHQAHLHLLKLMLKDRLWERLSESPSMSQAFEILRSYPTLGNFLAYQYITDLNYSTLIDFKETEFVVPGPGALNGIKKCFSNLGGLSEAEIIRYVCVHQKFFFDELRLNFQDLWGRPLQYIDCQNLFCEVDKYARVKHPEYSILTGRIRIKQIFKENGPVPNPFYPPKWKLKIPASF